MVSSMVVKSSSIMVETNTMASMNDRTFACLMSEVYKQKFEL